jgi:hypothetical protein
VGIPAVDVRRTGNAMVFRIGKIYTVPQGFNFEEFALQPVTRDASPRARTSPTGGDGLPRVQKNDDAERVLLGCILIDPTAFLKADVSAADFFDLRHETIFRAMCQMFEAGIAIDLVTVTDFLQTKNRLADAGGAAYVSSLTEGIPRISHVERYAAIVREKSRLRSLAAVGENLKNDALAGLEPATDLHDRAKLQLAEVPFDTKKIKAATASEVLSMQVSPKEYLLDGLLEANTINEVFARKGVGKTWLTLTMAGAIANGRECLKWKASRKRKVGYLDGELDLAARKERFTLLGISGENLQILSVDILDFPFPSLATADGQRMAEDAFDSIEVLFIDNLAALAPSSQDKETEEWVAIQTWLHDLKRRGISTVFNHHAGHAGWARGTTKREDLCSTVIKLQQPQNYSPAERCRFELHLDKNRPGVDASPIECALTTDLDGHGVWTWRDCEDVRVKQVRDLKGSGLSLRDIAKETGIPFSTVNRLLKRSV